MDGLLVYHVLPTLGWIELKSDPLNPMDACWLPPDPARPVARARTLHAESPRSVHLGNREWTGGRSQQQTGRNVKFTIQLVHSISIQFINLHQKEWEMKENGNSLEHPPWIPMVLNTAQHSPRLEAGTQIVLSHKRSQLLGRWPCRGKPQIPGEAMADESRGVKGRWLLISVAGNHRKSTLGRSQMAFHQQDSKLLLICSGFYHRFCGVSCLWD